MPVIVVLFSLGLVAVVSPAAIISAVPDLTIVDRGGAIVPSLAHLTKGAVAKSIIPGLERLFRRAEPP